VAAPHFLEKKAQEKNFGKKMIKKMNNSSTYARTVPCIYIFTQNFSLQ
jgi:hypothetical protein